MKLIVEKGVEYVKKDYLFIPKRKGIVQVKRNKLAIPTDKEITLYTIKEIKK